MDFSNLTPVAMFCPNCGHKVIGYKSDDGALRIQCPKCKVIIYSKYHSRKQETTIRVVSKQ